MPSGQKSPEQRYELVERIAVGGMAEVFRAKAYGSHGFEKVLAIKRILPALALDPAFERRFITEAKVACSLSHANIVQVFDFSRFGQSLYIVMELVDGCDLSRALQFTRDRGVLIPLEAAMHVAVEFLKGLDYAHKRGVVHRDVSPSNILCSRAGEVKIADFGIAQMGGSDSRTRTVKIMGKWRYMSPEQTTGEELDARSDVFSAGVVLHELFTGQRLFSGSDAEEVVHQIHTMELPPISQLRTDLPPELDAPLLAVLERDRDRRVMSPGDLLEAILEVCYAMSIPALPTSLARYIEEVTAGEGDDERSASPGLLDEIIVSEIGGRRPRTPPKRHTAMALAPPNLHPDDAPPPDPQTSLPPDRGQPTSVTMIRSVEDTGGMRRWVLEDAVHTVSGRPQGPTSARGNVIVQMNVATPVPGTLPPGTIPPTAPVFPTRYLAVGVGAVILIAIIAVVAVRRGRIEAATDPVEVVTAPGFAPPDAAPDAAPVAAPAPAPVPESPPAADAAPAPAPAPDAEQPTEPDQPPDAQPDRPSERPRVGTVDIYSDPWADIYLGKKKVGTAPQRGVKLPVGKHRLRLVNPVQNRSTYVTVTVPSRSPVRVTLPSGRSR